LATVNPAEKVEKLRGGSEGFYTWTDDDVEAHRSKVEISYFFAGLRSKAEGMPRKFPFAGR
jgi:hypothetical protein